MSPLLRLPLLRVLRSRATYAMLLAAFTSAVATAWVFRHREHGADGALLGPASSYIVPLAVYSLSGTVLGGSSVHNAVASLTLFGASRARATLGLVGAALVLSALLGATLLAAVAIVAHGASDPPLVRDVLVTARVGGLAAMAMAALFCFGALFGERGQGRFVALVSLFILAPEEDGLGVVVPLAQLRGLLGGVPPLQMGAVASQATMVAVVVVLAGLTMLRASRERT